MSRAVDDPLTVACPKCRARKTQPCVYVQMPASRPAPNHEWRPTDVRLLRRLGSPTQRPHIERYHRAWQRRVAASPRPVSRVPDDLLAASRAMREWDHREYVQLRDWFIENARLFGVRLRRSM